MKASEAAALADLIFQMAEGRPLGDDVRARIAGRVSNLGLESLVPYAGSLTRDPLHSSAYYIAVDSGGHPFLLHMTMASAPSNQTYPRSVLIGRMRPGGGREIVVNAIPFGWADIGHIETFADKIDRTFRPRAMGAQSAIVVEVRNPAEDLPVAFDAFRQIYRKTGQNLASFAGVPEPPVAIWAAIRAGWRFGYSLESVTVVRVRAAEGMALPPPNVDLELVFDPPVSQNEANARLQTLKDQGRPAQSVAPGPVDASTAAGWGAVLSFSGDGLDGETLRGIGRAAGKFRCRLTGPVTAQRIIETAEHLRS